MKKMSLKTMISILMGSALYATATHFFIFSNNLFLGGTSGISVILNHFFPSFSSGDFLMLINITLMLAAFVILGKSVALKTFLGSTLTTVFIGLLECIVAIETPLILNPLLCAILGSFLIACGSALLFYVDSSSGGTDIIAMIIKHFSNCNIGKALLVTDVIIVIVGACISSPLVAAASIIGLLIKTFGIDIIISLIQKATTST